MVPLDSLRSVADDTNAVALTFDDGLASIATEAAPLLAHHGFPATVFVVSGEVGRNNQWRGVGDLGIPKQRLLDWDELLQLQAQGFTVGAHTRHHPRLTSCSQQEQLDEIAGSAEEIARAIGVRPAAFAYPYGDLDAGVAAIAATEYATAWTTEFAGVEASMAAALSPRLDAWYFRDPARLHAWGSPRFSRWIGLRRALRRFRQLIR